MDGIEEIVGVEDGGWGMDNEVVGGEVLWEVGGGEDVDLEGLRDGVGEDIGDFEWGDVLCEGGMGRWLGNEEG